MKNFHNVSLPFFIATNAKGSPVFATSVATTASGREMRFADRKYSLQKYIVSNCRLSVFQFEEFNGFFRARRGQQHSFRMRDFADCMLFNQTLRVNASKAIFEVFKTYPDQWNTYNRRITKLVPNSVSLQVDNVDNMDLKPLSIDYDHGIITLAHPLQHDSNIVINGTFDIEVRFAEDNFKYSMHHDGSIILDDLEVIEVL